MRSLVLACVLVLASLAGIVAFAAGTTVREQPGRETGRGGITVESAVPPTPSATPTADPSPAESGTPVPAPPLPPAPVDDDDDDDDDGDTDDDDDG